MSATVKEPRARITNQREHRLKVLYRISDLINSTTNSNTLLRRVLRETVQALHATSGTIAFIQPLDQTLEIAVAQGIDQRTARAMRLKLGEGVTGTVAMTGKTMRVADVKNSPHYIELKRGIRSELAAPLKAEGKIMGVLNVDSTRQNAFSAEDEKLLTAVATQAARIIHTSRLYEQIGRQTQRLESLFDVGQALISPVPLPDVLNRIVNAVLELIDVKQCTVLLVSDQREMVLSAATGGGSGSYVQRPAHSMPDSLVGQVAARRQPVQVYEVRKPAKRRPGKVAARSKPVSLLAVPIFFQEHLVGILNVYTPQMRQFQSDEMRLLNAFASLCGIAIENARRYERVLVAEQNIRQADRLSTLGTLSAEIAHEIRNPVTIITMLMHSLREDGAIAPGRGRDVSIIQEKLERINRIISQVLAFAKRRGPKLEWVDINSVIEEVLFLVQHALSAKQVLVRRKLEAVLPPVLADRGHLDQVFLNLILNSIEAMPNGGILTAQTTLAPPREKNEGLPTVRATIRDTGVGITQELQEQIFEPFVTGREEGVGLGLFVSQKLLVQYGGKIHVRSAPGEGSSFTVILPAAPEEAAS